LEIEQESIRFKPSAKGNETFNTPLIVSKTAKEGNLMFFLAEHQHYQCSVTQSSL
jgi:hypothetical protein